ncbi:hypothetical protein SeMB42_g06287 [Synchytrium endobioticum]|uniref:Uncharacterized protein n=1 Tax=Synchytrium endobioticum TaxID=286115 RepID=A0A507CJ54_9FUNG|nr:hypothetical protein SeMB42_g06287 [Synchytrium endobioticum]
MKVVHPGLARARVERLARRCEKPRKISLRAVEQTGQFSDEEREQCLGLIVQGRTHLIGTWYDILEENVNEYIMIVDKAMADVKNFHYSAGVDSLASIQLVDGILLKVHHLISAYPAPENLPPDYLKLAALLHFLVIQRPNRANIQSSEMDELEEHRKLLLGAYNKDNRILPDLHISYWENARRNTDAQRDILDPGSSTYSGPYDSIEYGLGTRSRADFEGSSSSGGSQNRRNRHSGGRFDVGPWGLNILDESGEPCRRH